MKAKTKNMEDKFGTKLNVTVEELEKSWKFAGRNKRLEKNCENLNSWKLRQ